VRRSLRDRKAITWASSCAPPPETSVLRRRGGNAFHDEALDRLVGATITGVGLATDGTFIMDEFSVKEDPRR
jgi:hypothetical protein